MAHPRTVRAMARIPAESAVTAGDTATPAGTGSAQGAARRGGVALLPGAAAAALVLAAMPLPATPAAAAEPGAPTVDHHAVVLVNFRDRSLTDAAKVHAKAVSQFFGPTNSLAAYYAVNSGNRMSVVPAKGDGVFGPFTIDFDGSGCDSGKIADLARKVMPATVSYDHLSIVMPATAACNWWGLGSVPGPTTWFQEGAVNGEDYAAALHEFGHNLGFAHEGREFCPPGSFSGCTADGYSRRSPMGAGGEHKGLSAPELMAVKWLTADQIAAPKSSTTVHLTPLHAPAAASGTRAIDLPLGSTGDRIVVEFRAPAPNTPDTDVLQGVDVFRVPKGNYFHSVMISNSKESAKEGVGSFTTTAALTDASAHISLTYGRMTAQGVDVTVDLAYSAKASAAPSSAKPSPTPTPTTQDHALPTDQGDSAKDLGPAKPDSASSAAADAASDTDHSELATSTTTTVLAPALIGSAGIAAGGAILLVRRSRRRTRQRRH